MFNIPDSKTDNYEKDNSAISNNLSREVFLNKIIRVGLMLFLAIVTMVVWGRIVTGKNCSSCPGNGICNGDSDCKKY